VICTCSRPRTNTPLQALVLPNDPCFVECARALGQRGYRVTLAERARQAGGRVTREGSLPSLREWLRVRDWRLGQLRKMPNVDLYLESDMTAESVLELGASHVVLATGARWRADGVGRATHLPIPIEADMPVLTPDDVMEGHKVTGEVLVFDDDHYYMGSLVAESLARAGASVTLVTPAAEVAAFTAATLELRRIAQRLDELRVRVVTHHALIRAGGGEAKLQHVHTGRTSALSTSAMGMATARLQEDRLHRALEAMPDRVADAGITSITRIGDCLAPGAIFHAVYAGHRYAREFEAPAAEVPFKRERVAL